MDIKQGHNEQALLSGEPCRHYTDAFPCLLSQGFELLPVITSITSTENTNKPSSLTLMWLLQPRAACIPEAPMMTPTSEYLFFLVFLAATTVVISD